MKKSWSDIWNDIRNNEDFSELKRGTLKDVLNGNFLLSDFMKRQLGLFALIAILMFFYIDNRYHCEKQQALIMELQKKITDAHYEELTTSSDLTKLSRRSNVLQLLKEKGLDLTENTDSPIIVD